MIHRPFLSRSFHTTSTSITSSTCNIRSNSSTFIFFINVFKIFIQFLISHFQLLFFILFSIHIIFHLLSNMNQAFRTFFGIFMFTNKMLFVSIDASLGYLITKIQIIVFKSYSLGNQTYFHPGSFLLFPQVVVEPT